MQIVEKYDLSFFFGAFRFRDIRDLRFDAHGRGFSRFRFFFLDGFFPFYCRNLSDFAVFPSGINPFAEKVNAFDEGPDAFDKLKPGHLEKKAETQGAQQDEQKRAAGKPEIMPGGLADNFADDTPGNTGQPGCGVVHAQVFDAGTGNKQNDEPGIFEDFVPKPGRFRFFLKQKQS